MKIISIAACLAAIALVAVEAASSSNKPTGSLLRARMIPDTTRIQFLQRRGDLYSDDCAKATGAGMASMVELTKELQDPSVGDADRAKVMSFQQAINHAYGQPDEDAFDDIESTYSEAKDALGGSSSVAEALDNMMSAVRNAKNACS
ncbi:hypothetical protein BGX29_001680 [Mortierella sp. GBA35]|nr:hypothetical protein BGX29_001680 [Mortierella sp. GBA35]